MNILWQFCMFQWNGFCIWYRWRNYYYQKAFWIKTYKVSKRYPANDDIPHIVNIGVLE